MPRLARRPWVPDPTMVELARHRKRMRMTIREVHMLSGLAASTIAHIENGHNDPTLGTLRLYTAALGVRLRDVIDIGEHRGPNENPCNPG